MQTVLGALAPVLLLIATGWGLANYRILPRESWSGIDTLSYWILFPAVLFTNVAGADFSSLDLGSYAIALYGALALLCILLVPLGRLLKSALNVDSPSFSSIFQGTTRWNAFIAMAIASNLMGQTGLALTAITMALLIPIMNVLSITMMTVYASSSRLSLGSLLWGIIRNPFIVSISAGLLLNISGLALPPVLADYTSFLGRAALPLAILSVGAAIDLNSLRRPGPRLLVGLGMRLIISPAVALFVATVVGLAPETTLMLVLAFAVPTAASAYVLAKQMGGNAPLMAELLALQTVVSAVTVPLWLLLLI